MYEFGEGYEARVQDPSDPNYEYNTRSIKSTKPDGSSTCTYEEVVPYFMYWKSGDYKLFTNNCQNFVVGLTNYLKRNCANLSKYGKRSDDEMAEYFFNISAVDCTDTYSTDATTSSATTIEKPFTSLAALIIVGLAMW